MIFTTRSEDFSFRKELAEKAGFGSKAPQFYRSSRKRRYAKPQSHVSLSRCARKNGRGERIRTSDPLVPNQVLYQAEPLPELAVGKDSYELKGPWLSPS
jgi:hypothetical protein